MKAIKSLNKVKQVQKMIPQRQTVAQKDQLVTMEDLIWK